MELVHVGTRDFYSTILQTGVGVDRLLVAEQSVTWDMRRFYVLANSVSCLLVEHQWDQAQLAYSQTIDLVGLVLRDRNPVLLVCLLQICCRFYKEQQLPALQLLLALIRSMAAQIHSVSHSTHYLCEALMQSQDVLVDMVVMGLRQAFEILKYQLGVEHPQTCAAGRGLHTALMTKGDFEGALVSFRPIAEVEARYDMDMQIESFYRVIGTHLAMADLHIASLLLHQGEDMIDVLEDGEKKAWYVLCNLSSKGELFRLQRHPMAVEVLSAAAEFAAEHRWLDNGRWCLNAKKALRLATSLSLAEPLVPFVFWY